MNFVIHFWFFSLQLAFLMAVPLEELPTEKKVDSEVLGSFPSYSSSCGDTLTASSGRISYKTFESVQPNERCVWILRYPGATSYSVTLTNLGIPSSVILTGFYYRAAVTQNVPTSTNTVSFPSANILVVTFYTGPTNISNRGFSLTFQATVNSTQQQANSTSEDVTIPAGNGHVKYPNGRTSYSDFELSTFIANPYRNPLGGFKKTELIYVKLLLESCFDVLKVYIFNLDASSTNKWQQLGQICNDVESEVITNNDLIMIIFTSDSSNQGTGFHLLSRAA